jgi:hypothetical protein
VGDVSRRESKRGLLALRPDSLIVQGEEASEDEILLKGGEKDEGMNKWARRNELSKKKIQRIC